MTRYEILPPEQKALLPLLQPTRALGYTLYGGTAIALQLGHRDLVDFDFFTDKPVSEGGLKRAMPMLRTARTLQKDDDTWVVNVKPDGMDKAVKVSFFGKLSFGRVGQPVVTDGKELALASLDDLMGNKLKVLLQRAESKDYVDIAAMLKAGQSLERGLGAAASMFPTFPPAEALRALTYFEGGDLQKVGRADRAFLERAAQKVGSVIEMPIVSRDLGGPVPEGRALSAKGRGRVEF